MTRRACWVIALCLAVACSGSPPGAPPPEPDPAASSSSPSPTLPAVSAEDLRKAYLLQADQVCGETSAEMADATPPETLQQLKEQLSRIISLMKRMLGDLRRLTPPPADAPTIDAVLAKYDAALAAFEQGLRSANAGNSSSSESAFNRGVTLLDQAFAAAGAYGFYYCAGNG